MSFTNCKSRISGNNYQPSTSQMPSTIQKEPVDLNATQAFCLRWNNYQSNMVNVLDQIFHDEKYVDVTLVCENTFIKAHKIVLSACSPYFQHIFDSVPSPHPVIILKDMLLTELKPILDFMYKGEIYVAKEQIGILLRVAENLKVRGLAEVAEENVDSPTEQNEPVTKESAKRQSRSSKRKADQSANDAVILCETDDEPTIQLTLPTKQSPTKKKKPARSNPRKQSLVADEIREEAPVVFNDIQFDDENYPVDITEIKEEILSDNSAAEKVSFFINFFLLLNEVFL